MASVPKPPTVVTKVPTTTTAKTELPVMPGTTVVPVAGPPAANQFETHPDYEGLTVYFGPGPLPPAGTMPNTVYIILPTV